MDPSSKSLLNDKCLTVCGDGEDTVDEINYRRKSVNVKMYVVYLQMPERESWHNMEMKNKNQITVSYKRKMSWSVLNIQSPICPFVMTILAPSSAVNYIDIIKSKLFLCITHYQSVSFAPTPSFQPQ